MSGRSSINLSGCVLVTGCVLVRGSSSYANRSVTGCVPVPGICLPGPRHANRSVTGCIAEPSTHRPGPGVGRQLILGPFRFGPAQGPESACLSRIRGDFLHADGSRDDWHMLLHPVRSRVRPTRQAKITSVSAVPSSTGPSPVPTTLSSPSVCSRLILWLLFFT